MQFNNYIRWKNIIGVKKYSGRFRPRVCLALLSKTHPQVSSVPRRNSCVTSKPPPCSISAVQIAFVPDAYAGGGIGLLCARGIEGRCSTWFRRPVTYRAKSGSWFRRVVGIPGDHLPGCRIFPGFRAPHRAIGLVLSHALPLIE